MEQWNSGFTKKEAPSTNISATGWIRCAETSDGRINQPISKNASKAAQLLNV